jgi:hypothetical protein
MNLVNLGQPAKLVTQVNLQNLQPKSLDQDKKNQNLRNLIKKYSITKDPKKMNPRQPAKPKT